MAVGNRFALLPRSYFKLEIPANLRTLDYRPRAGPQNPLDLC